MPRPAPPRRPSTPEGDVRQRGGCWNYFSNQCSVDYHFVNLGGGARDNLFLNKVGDVEVGPRAMQKEAPKRAHQAGVPVGSLWGGSAMTSLDSAPELQGGEVGRSSCQPPPAHDTAWPFLGRRWDTPTYQLPTGETPEPSLKPTRQPLG